MWNMRARAVKNFCLRSEASSPELECSNAVLRKNILKVASRPGNFSTPVEGLRVTRLDHAGTVDHCIYRPCIGLVVQGCKRSAVGKELLLYGPLTCIVTSVDVPSCSSILAASPERPFLAITLALDKRLAMELVAELPTLASGSAEVLAGQGTCGVCAAPVDPHVLEAFSRLVSSLDTPGETAVLAPLIIREIYYRILTSAQGVGLLQVCRAGSKVSEIARVIGWLREHFREQLNMEAFAKMAGMSQSTFYRQFKLLMSVSPLQFQKRLRLYAAQSLMLAEGMDAAGAGAEVGYESPTQFNREYKRLFGEPPLRDIKRLQAMNAEVTASLQ